MYQVFSSGHESWPHALYPAVGCQVRCGMLRLPGRPRERPGELFPRQGRPGSGLSAHIMRAVGLELLQTAAHHRYLIRRNPAQGHHHVMSRAAPGVPSCDVRNPRAGSDTSQDGGQETVSLHSVLSFV